MDVHQRDKEITVLLKRKIWIIDIFITIFSMLSINIWLWLVFYIYERFAGTGVLVVINHPGLSIVSNLLLIFSILVRMRITKN